MTKNEARMRLFSDFLKDSAQIFEEIEVNYISLLNDLSKIDNSLVFPTFRLEKTQNVISQKTEKLKPIPPKPALPPPAQPPQSNIQYRPAVTTLPPQPNPQPTQLPPNQSNQIRAMRVTDKVMSQAYNQIFMPTQIQQQQIIQQPVYYQNPQISPQVPLIPQNYFQQPQQNRTQSNMLMGHPIYNQHQTSHRPDIEFINEVKSFIISLSTTGTGSFTSDFLIQQIQKRFPQLKEKAIKKLLKQMVDEGTFDSR